MTISRLYPILDAKLLAERNCTLLDAAEGMLEGGAHILQWRFKTSPGRRQMEEAARVAESCRHYGALFIVNDRADIAMMLGAGLHVGQDDLPAADARRVMGPDPIIGLSTHTAAQLTAAAAEPVDYLAIGPIFGTSTKENPDPMIGLAQLHDWRKLVNGPLVAIGGISLDNALAVLEAGADSIAIVSGMLPETCTRETIRRRTEDWIRLSGG